ncbi:hypothetical protein LX99_01979 [Mucilaginibacter oryzae]|uniref:Uncharacterized protein n=1 Tax=Mucilaginibacter oryzae TaxID=468058 RepID=A0A316HAB6_9SPHI|nr:hypothetical protein [Mucilaginibacter oryzae]PWK78139.1 hypothetical protein LX99_01979 [Mucilaginibacter oryzae]
MTTNRAREIEIEATLVGYLAVVKKPVTKCDQPPGLQKAKQYYRSYCYILLKFYLNI